jgi:UrcA family protein
MKTAKRSLTARALLGSAVVLATVGLSTAKADEPEVITVAAPKVNVIAHGPGAATATQQVTVTAHVQYDPVTLTTNSGVALLKDGVEQAARRVCRSADPGAPEDMTCVRSATDSAAPQIDAAVARARGR